MTATCTSPRELVSTGHTAVRSARGSFAALLCAALLVGAALMVPVTAGAANRATSQPVGAEGDRIRVTEEPSGNVGSCRPRVMALGRTVTDTAETFTVEITVRQPLCTPIAVTAAVYRMPGRGVAWPQQLLETEGFTLEAAGTVRVSFTKGCEPVQFDIVTGETPSTIAPWAAWHGQLLFPMDFSTTLQHWGGDCSGATTTVPSTPPPTEPPGEPGTTLPGAPVTVPSGSEPTLPPEVLGTTTVPSATGEPGADAPATPVATRQPPVTEPDVLGSSSSVPGLPADLALTGVAARALVVVGVLLLLIGVGMLVGGRLRSRSAGS